MLDQVLQTRVDQQMAALMGAIRAAVSGNTGLSQGQTALAVVQAAVNAGVQNQYSGSPSSQLPADGTGKQGNPPSAGAGAPPTAATANTAANGATSAGANIAQAATNLTAQATAAQLASAAQSVALAAQQTGTNSTSQSALQAQAILQAQAALQATPQGTNQAQAQALVNQIQTQTSSAMIAALANTTPGTGATQPGAGIQNTPSGGQNVTSAPPQNPTMPQNTAATQSTTTQSRVQGSHNQPIAATGTTLTTQSGTTANQLSGTQTAVSSAASTQSLNQPSTTASAVRVLIPLTGQSIELPQLKPLPAGTQITLRQANSTHVDILKVQLPQNQQTNQSQSTQTHQVTQTNSAVANQVAQKVALQQTVMSALREALPAQQPVSDTISRVQSLVSQLSPTVRDNPALQQALQIIDKATLKLSSENAPTAQAVKQSIQRSGVFHEAVMMQALQQSTMPAGTPITPVGDDLKGAFFQIFRQLTRGGRSDGTQEKKSPNSAKAGTEATADSRQNSQAQLSRTLNEGLARIRSNQLQSNPAMRGTEATASSPIQTDIPVTFNGQLSEVKVKIDQEIWPENQSHENGEEYQRRWVINLSFSPPELGNLHARLLYQNEKLKTHLWVEQDENLPGISKQLHELKDRLAALGIEIEEVRCQAGRPEKIPDPTVLSLKA
ncbi:flagellar hook-length control protein FliK [Oceanospirillum sp.]|uniref:flagellar hook-length control protein FliK n=1 Tax=Oceanospirillum sp. TaxID=2021254 RepID=UPI003A8F6B6D